jgi:hypothetical protein
MFPFTRGDLERLFPPTVWKRAEALAQNGAVVDVEMERDGRSITGKVKGERRTPFLTRVKIANGRGGRVRLTSTCTCLVYSECEHAAATLLGLLDKVAAPEPDDVVASLDPEVESWLAAIGAAARATQLNGSGEGQECIVYRIEPAQRSWRQTGAAQPIAVTTSRARQLAGGSYGREQPLAIAALTAEDPPPFVRLEDQIIGRLLGAGNTPTRRLGGLADGETLRRMLETGRCHWRNGHVTPLAYGGERPGRFGWRFDSDGQQHVVCEVEGGGEEVVVVGLGRPSPDPSPRACPSASHPSSCGRRRCRPSRRA